MVAVFCCQPSRPVRLLASVDSSLCLLLPLASFPPATPCECGPSPSPAREGSSARQFAVRAVQQSLRRRYGVATPILRRKASRRYQEAVHIRPVTYVLLHSVGVNCSAFSPRPSLYDMMLLQVLSRPQTLSMKANGHCSQTLLVLSSTTHQYQRPCSHCGPWLRTWPLHNSVPSWLHACISYCMSSWWPKPTSSRQPLIQEVKTSCGASAAYGPTTVRKW